MKLEKLVGKKIYRTKPVKYGEYYDESYMYYPVLLVRYNYIDNTIVVSDNEHGYSALLGSEWVDDNWTPSDAVAPTNDEVPQYDKLFHMIPSNNFESGRTLQDMCDKAIKADMTSGTLFSDNKEISLDNLLEEYSTLIAPFTAIGICKKNTDKCINGGRVDISDMDEDTAIMLLCEYILEYYKNMSSSTPVADIPGVELWYDDEFIIRFVSDSDNNSVFHLELSQAENSMKIVLNDCDSNESVYELVYKFIFNRVFTIPCISTLAAAVSADIFSLKSLLHDNSIRYAYITDDYSYSIFAADSIYHMILKPNGSMICRKIGMRDLLDINGTDSMAILPDDDSIEFEKILAEMRE